MVKSTTLVKISRDGSCIALETISREHGRHGRFLLVVDNLREWMRAPEFKRGSFVDTDCGNFLQIWKDEKCDIAALSFTWLSEYRNGEVKCCREFVRIPYLFLMGAVHNEHYSKKVIGLKNEPGDISFADNARKMIAKMNKKERRAFCKAMGRDACHYPYTDTVMYADGGRDFFFRTSDGLCGGLVLHHMNNGGLVYGVHT